MKLKSEMNCKQPFARDTGSRELDAQEIEKQGKNPIWFSEKVGGMLGACTYVWRLHADVFLVLDFFLSFFLQQGRRWW